MTYRQLLAAVERAKELEQDLFWARDREASVNNPHSKFTPEQRGGSIGARIKAERAFDAEIVFDV